MIKSIHESKVIVIKTVDKSAVNVIKTVDDRGYSYSDKDC